MPTAAAHRTNLTVGRAAALVAAGIPGRYWDAAAPQLYLRVRREGVGAWFVRYRTPGGRAGTTRDVHVGDADRISPDVARATARRIIGEVAGGTDVAAERAAQRNALTVAEAIEQYVTTLTTHRNAKTIASILRRELAAHLGTRPLAQLTRRDVADRVTAVTRDGRPGAADMLRTRAAVFCNWAVGAGHLAASPLAGWRRPRATRAEALATAGRAGRALDQAEVALLLAASQRMLLHEGAMIRAAIFTGMRRAELEGAEWGDLETDQHGTWLHVPGERCKNGRAHRALLPPDLAADLATLHADALGQWCFSGSERPLGHNRSRLDKRLAEAVAAEWRARRLPGAPGIIRLHDLRRTFRTALSEAGVAFDLAEVMIGHARSDLAERYDRAARLGQRAEASRAAWGWLTAQT
jgi:integrase